MPKKGFSDINDLRHRLGPLEPVAALGRTLPRLIAHLRFHLQLSNLLANGETPSRSPQATNYYSFLTIALVHSVYASVQGLSRWLQCYDPEGPQATPEEVSKLSETRSSNK